LATTETIRVRVTPLAGQRVVCWERDVRHPGGQAKVKGVRTEHTVGQTPTIVAGLKQGTLEIIPKQKAPAAAPAAAAPTAAATPAADTAADLEIPPSLWASTGVAEVQGAKVLGDIPDAVLAQIAKANPRSQDERKFITAAKGRVTKSRSRRTKTRYTKAG
jgi:hypothetical protein